MYIVRLEGLNKTQKVKMSRMSNLSAEFPDIKIQLQKLNSKSRKSKILLQLENNVGQLFMISENPGEVDFCTSLNDDEMDGNVTTGQQLTMDEQEQQITTDYDNLQIWYNLSPPWRRFTLQMIGILIFALICHIIGFLLAVFYMDQLQGSNDPYHCETEHCHTVSKFLQETMNTSVKPCEDFYQHVCGNYLKTQKAENLLDPGLFLMLTTLQSDVTEREAYGAVFRDTDSPMNKQITTFFKSCLDYSARNEVGDKPFLEMLDEIGLNLDNPTKDLSEIVYDVWHFTGSVGFFGFHLYYNPYDGYKKYQVLGECSPGLCKKSLQESAELYLPDFKNIVTLLGVKKYTAEEMHAAMHLMVKTIIDTKNKDEQTDEDGKKTFNCDTFSKRLDPTFGKFDLSNMQETFGDGSPNLFASEFRNYANFMCNGRLVTSLKKLTSSNKYSSNVTPELAFKSFWILHLLNFYIADLSPKTKDKFDPAGIFRRQLQDVQPGAECLRSLKARMPHLVHERLMQVYDVTEEKIFEVEDQFRKMHNRLREWLTHDDRKKSFGDATLTKLRKVIDWYVPMSYSFRFSVKQLEDFGYGETAKELTQYNYVDNIKKLRQVITHIEIKRWRGIDKLFVPSGASAFRYALQEMGIYQTILRPTAFTSTLVPALAYSPLYSNGDILSIKYGSIWTFLMLGVFNAWRNTCDDQGIKVTETIPCTIITTEEDDDLALHPSSNTTPINSEFVSGSGVDRAGWLDVLIDLLMDMLKSEQQERDNKNIFGFKRLIGMEKYTPEQLFFLKLTRHACSGEIDFIQDLRSGLARSSSFSETWNCQPGSLMNAEKKCLTSPE